VDSVKRSKMGGTNRERKGITSRTHRTIERENRLERWSTKAERKILKKSDSGLSHKRLGKSGRKRNERKIVCCVKSRV